MFLILYCLHLMFQTNGCSFSNSIKCSVLVLVHSRDLAGGGDWARSGRPATLNNNASLSRHMKSLLTHQHVGNVALCWKSRFSTHPFNTKRTMIHSVYEALGGWLLKSVKSFYVNSRVYAREGIIAWVNIFLFGMFRDVCCHHHCSIFMWMVW